MLQYSNIRNFAMWESSETINGDEHMAYLDAVARLKTAHLARITWLDSAIENFVLPPNPESFDNKDGSSDQFTEGPEESCE